MLPLERWNMPARAVLADMCRFLLRADVIVQRAMLGDDAVVRQRKLDSCAVFLAAYDYAIATSRDRGVAAFAALPQLRALLPAASDDDPPPIALVLELRFFAYQLDIDSLADDDANDLQQERDWCDYWYSWHASRLDAS